MARRRSDPLRTNQATAILDSYGDGAIINLRTGAPDGVGGAGTLLATFTCGTPFGTVTEGVLTAGAIPSTTAVADGTVGHYEILNSSNVFQESGAATGDGMTISNLSLTNGQPVSITNFSLTMPFDADA